MGKIGRRIKKAFKKAGRAMGGPVTAAVDAGRAVKQGKGAKGAAKAFAKSSNPGASVQEMHDAHVDAFSATTEAALGAKAAGRVEDLGRITKPAMPDSGGRI